jgi:hypothetical protein
MVDALRGHAVAHELLGEHDLPSVAQALEPDDATPTAYAQPDPLPLPNAPGPVRRRMIEDAIKEAKQKQGGGGGAADSAPEGVEISTLGDSYLTHVNQYRVSNGWEVTKITGAKEEIIGGNKKEMVVGSSESVILGDAIESVSGTKTETIKGSETKTVNGSVSETLHGTKTETIIGGVLEMVGPAQVSIGGGKKVEAFGGFCTEAFGGYKLEIAAGWRSEIGALKELKAGSIKQFSVKHEINCSDCDITGMGKVTITSSHITGQSPTTLLTGELNVKGKCLFQKNVVAGAKLKVAGPATMEELFKAVDQCHLG